MSSSISIGFVFEKEQNISSKFSEFLNFLIDEGEFQNISYSFDKYGNEWNKEIIKDFSTLEVVSLMVNNFFGKIHIKTKVLKEKKIDAYISIHKFLNGDFGFLIEINVCQLFKVGNKKELENNTISVIKLCEEIFYKIKYCYAFCDHEVNIEYTWDEFSKMNGDIYSISIIPSNTKFSVSLASWEIDGLTTRIKNTIKVKE